MYALRYMWWFLLLTLSAANAADRCQQYVQTERKAHALYFGLDFPYQYAVGQIKQESGCRDIESLDGEGSTTPAQITKRVWQDQFNAVGIASAHWSVQQAYIMHEAHKHNPYGKLWITYQQYNGGALVLKEIARAGTPEWAAAKAKCRRGVTHYRSGDISNCDINYDYSIKVFNYGKQYGEHISPTYPFW